MYPIKFKKIYKEKVWGGQKFHDLLGMDLPNSCSIGESWEISSHRNGLSIVENGCYKGMSLRDLIFENGYELLGKSTMEKYHGEFPLLIKYLDINDKLSVQVHPNDEFVKKTQSGFGKFESWYVMDATEDATLILGIKSGINKDEFKNKIKHKNIKGLFNEIKVKKGDFLDIRPGLIHGSLKGSLVLCEVQQNSDTTYRIWDFDREINGKKRELHIDIAMEVIDVDVLPKISTYNTRDKYSLIGGSMEILTRSEYYSIDRIILENGLYNPELKKQFTILSILDGNGSLAYEKEIIEIIKGETYLIPANLKIEIKGSLELLSSYI